MEPGPKEFILTFLKDKGCDAEGVEFQSLQGDGSTRLFWRITTPTLKQSLITMANPPEDNASTRENFAYVMIGKHLRGKGIPVPEIYQYDLEHGRFIMEDMGHTSLQDMVCSKQNPLPIYEKVLTHLFQMQIEGAKGFDPAWCCHTQRYDRTVMRRYESDYFRDAFLSNYLGLKKEWPELETPFNHLAETGSRADSGFFLHRDFQSRNIMISKGAIGIVDWQGGRLGPLGYDIASLLIDPYTALSRTQRNKLYQTYLLLIKEHNAKWIDSFERYFPYLAIQRNLQILGAFSYLTKKMKKRYFEDYIPASLESLYGLLHQVGDRELSPLKELVKDLQCHKKSLDTPGRAV
jgi:aminoglycoside/choline kinase family phosphotransferase